MKVHVDDDVCGGHGVCAALCPQVFEISADGFAVVLVDEVPEAHEAAVREAVEDCPSGAITLG